jgi:hypothetical protein
MMVTMRRVFLVVLVVLMVLTVIWALPGEVVTNRYGSLEEARADHLFERGWLPDLLPASARDLRLASRPDLANSTGEFHFAPADFAAFGKSLSAYTRPKSPFSGFADEVDGHIHRGHPAFQYVADGNTWVFMCIPEQGVCSYAMWISR